MPGNSFGELFRVTTFGESHGPAIGCVVDGCPPGLEISAEEIRAYRGTLTEPGKESPYRNRSVEENLDLFERMRAGEFPDGAHVLRAKIDMSSGNLNMRDPVMYRILHASHHRQLIDLFLLAFPHLERHDSGPGHERERCLSSRNTIVVHIDVRSCGF